MKKLLVMVFAAMTVSASVYAQSDEPKNELGVFYGFGSASDIISTYATSFSFKTGDQSGFWGPIGVEYYRHLTPLIAVGGMFEYAGCKLAKLANQNGDMKVTYFTVMPSVKFNWLRKSHFGMYSALSAGMMIASLKVDDVLKTAPDVKDETVTDFMFQITALGLEAGKDLRGFAEFGVGEKGIICAGLRYKF